MSQKQDRINEVLAERISQLENELRSATNGKERAEKETRLVKDEAYEVVGQWSAENAELRRRLTAIEEDHAAAEAELKNRDETIACLKEELSVAQQLSVQYAQTVTEVEKKNAELAEKAQEASSNLSTAQSTIAASAQQLSDYEHLVSKFEVELKDLIASRKRDEDAIAVLQKSLDAATNENRVLRHAGEEVSSSTGKLLDRVSALKGENESLTRTRERLANEVRDLTLRLTESEQEKKQHLARSESLAEKLVAATQEVQRLRSDYEETAIALQDTRVSLSAAEATAAQQLDLLQNLENDVQELKDNGITTGKVIVDLQGELDFARQQIETLSKEKEDRETEFATVQECYSTVLLEFDDFKRSSAKAIDAMKNDFEQTKKDLVDRLALAEENYKSAWSSLQDLTGALHAQQVSELVKKEQLTRCSIAAEQNAGWCNMLEQRIRTLTQQLQKSLTATESKETRILQLENAAAASNEKMESLSSRFRSCEQTLSEQRRAFSALEAQLAQSSARLKECSNERDTLAKDNEWLKTQVESMRQELGELDEILNTNLNEMREENERVVLDNEALHRRLASADEKAAQAASTAEKLENQVAGVESELRAQTKTLEITEAELQASKARVENLTTSLQIAQKKLEELEVVNVDLTEANSTLSAQVSELQERVGNQDSKLTLILADKRKESDTIKAKLNAVVERYERAEQKYQMEVAAKKDAELAHVAVKEQNAKLRSALDELKARCASDAASLTELLKERDDLIRDRDIIVEKYNKLHDAFRSVRKEAHGKVAEELRRVMELAVSQEAELQTLRKQNVTLKKSVSMFVDSAQPKAEAIFTERLNLTEGPLRHPKKRSTANMTDPKE